MPAPLDPAVKAAIEADVRAGELSRNAIARAHSVGQGTVSRIAKALEAQGAPPAFDRAAVEAATAARSADMADRRTRLAADLLADAERMRAQLWAPCTWGNFGGKENDYNSVELDQPRFVDQATILGAVEKAVRTSTNLTNEDTDPTEAAKSSVRQLVESLRAEAAA